MTRWVIICDLSLYCFSLLGLTGLSINDSPLWRGFTVVALVLCPYLTPNLSSSASHFVLSFTSSIPAVESHRKIYFTESKKDKGIFKKVDHNAGFHTCVTINYVLHAIKIILAVGGANKILTCSQICVHALANFLLKQAQWCSCEWTDHKITYHMSQFLF